MVAAQHPTSAAAGQSLGPGTAAVKFGGTRTVPQSCARLHRRFRVPLTGGIVIAGGVAGVATASPARR